MITSPLEVTTLSAMGGISWYMRVPIQLRIEKETTRTNPNKNHSRFILILERKGLREVCHAP
jgi:hypothetical protein